MEGVEGVSGIGVEGVLLDSAKLFSRGEGVGEVEIGGGANRTRRGESSTGRLEKEGGVDEGEGEGGEGYSMEAKECKSSFEVFSFSFFLWNTAKIDRFSFFLSCVVVVFIAGALFCLVVCGVLSLFLVAGF